MAIKCPKCQAENPDTKKFCVECGTQLLSDIRTVDGKNSKASEVQQNKIPFQGESIFKTNQPEYEPWISAIGGFMMNFGALELAVNVWIIRLAKDELLHDLSIEMNFARRMQLLRQLVDRQDMPRELKIKIKSFYKKIKSLSELRNTVAHNPLVFAWHGTDKTGLPDFVGIPNMQSLKHNKPRVDPLIDLKKLKTAVNELISLAQFFEVAFASLPDSPPKKG